MEPARLSARFLPLGKSPDHETFPGCSGVAVLLTPRSASLGSLMVDFRRHDPLSGTMFSRSRLPLPGFLGTDRPPPSHDPPVARRPDEEPDLKLAEELIFRGRGLTLERFDPAATLAGRTPDFRVLLGDTLKAFCEVKSPRDDWLDDQIEAASPGQIAGGARSDPTFNRIARHVDKGSVAVRCCEWRSRSSKHSGVHQPCRCKRVRRPARNSDRHVSF